MGLYNFQKQFRERVIEGIKAPSKLDAKVQTVRARRKHRDEAMVSAMFLYCGLRTKHCERLGAVPCLWTAEVMIDNQGYLWLDDYKVPTQEDRNLFARRDGFEMWAHMMDFFRPCITPEQPFIGDVYSWFDYRPEHWIEGMKAKRVLLAADAQLRERAA